MLRCVFLLLVMRIAAMAVGQDIPLEQLAADSSVVYRFELHDGALVIGRVRAMDADSIHVVDRASTHQSIARTAVARVTRLDEKPGSAQRQWFAAPVPSRLLIGPTAIAMEPGEMRYTNTYFLFHSLTAGLTKRLSIGLGTEMTSLLGSTSPGPILFGTVKYGGEVADGLHLAAQGMVLSLPYSGWFNSGPGRLNLGLAGGLVTVGDGDAQLTAGASWSVLKFSWATPYPLVTVGGQWRFGKRFAFVTENWVLPARGEQSPYLLSYAVRIMGKELAGDFGFFNNRGISQSIGAGIPYASFTAKW